MLNFLFKHPLCSLYKDYPWCVDHVAVNNNEIEISGWAISPSPEDSSTFLLNDKVFDSIDYPLERADIGHLFDYVKNANLSGFVCKAKINPDTDEFAFSFADKTSLKAHNPNQVYYFKPGHQETVVVPPAENRRRVHGGDSESAFLLEGFSTFKKLQLAVKETFQKSFDDYSSILDWGSGCGRVHRYFSTFEKPKTTGVDIDENNVEWCRENIPFSSFFHVPLMPPTALESQAFDLLIGISIFTHLKEREQFAWLEELQRISKKGAVLLMTVHGNTTACRSGSLAKTIRKWLKTGFYDLGGNADLTGAISDPEYYKNVLHTEEYVMNAWSKYFHIEKIIPGYIGNHQDLVIMTRR